MIKSRNIFQKIRNTLSGKVVINAELLALTIFLLSIMLVLFGNIVRVVVNAKSNYETYIREEESLDKLREKNATLQAELDYVTNDEYKKILLRENGYMAEESERLFKTKGTATYFDEEKELMSIEQVEGLNGWWSKIF